MPKKDNRVLFDIVSIMRNEANTLPRLLRSLEDFKQRGGLYYILDTGSTDDSVKIARDWGCIVEEAGEKYLHTIDIELADKINERFIGEETVKIVKEGDKYFDFASARNASSELTNNNWVCTVDCDEEFTVFDIDKINEAISDPNLAHCEYRFVFAHKPDGSPAVQFTQSKFFDKTKIEWKNIVHEVISPINGGGSRTYLPDDIFLLEHWQQQGDRHSYLKGLAVDCYLHSDSDRNSHYFARELMYSGRFNSAIKEFKRHVEMNGWEAERAQSMIHIADCCGFLGKETEKIEWLHRAFDLNGEKNEALVKLADHYARKADKKRALAYAKAALEIPYTGFYADNMENYFSKPLDIISWAKGDYSNEIEGWMRPEELRWLYNTAKTVNSILEIGSWKGRSTHALLSGCKGTVTACDTFKGSDDVKDLSYKIAKQENIKDQFIKNVGHFNNLEVLEMTSEEANKPMVQFDMIFIDALHTYEGVKKDIELWKDRATKILCGHDYDPVAWPDVVRAVDECLGKPDEVHGSIWVKYL